MQQYIFSKSTSHWISKNGLTKLQLIEILRWKSPRPLQLYEMNTEQQVKEITALSFITNNENLKIHILAALTGVNYPAASEILMFYDKTMYPILDIWVWQQLHRAKFVYLKSRGQNFTLQQWGIYLNVIRNLARDLGLTASQIEKRIFDYDKKT